jgi:YfiH family protein
LTIPDGFQWRQTAHGRALVCRALEPYALHLFTTREWPLGTARDAERAAAWDDVARALGVDAVHFVRAHQVHGAAVIVRRREDTARSADRRLPAADIIVSNDPSVAIAIQTADCVPLLIADTRTGAVAAAHAGWRGLSAQVPAVAVRAMTEAFGARAGDLVAAIGPSICADRYEVDAVVRAGFEQGGFAAEQLARWFLPGSRADHWQFDGWAAPRHQH